jgi:hypothetical protein
MKSSFFSLLSEAIIVNPSPVLYALVVVVPTIYLAFFSAHFVLKAHLTAAARNLTVPADEMKTTFFSKAIPSFGCVFSPSLLAWSFATQRLKKSSPSEGYTTQKIESFRLRL